MENGSYDIIEFNVPPSIGTTVQHPSPQDQYPLNSGLKTANYEALGMNLAFKNYDGDFFSAGWALIEPLPNSTGLRPGERQQKNFRIAMNPTNYTIDAMGNVPADLFHYGQLPGDSYTGVFRTLRLKQTSLLKQNTYLQSLGTDGSRDRYVLYNAPDLLGFNPDRYVGSDAGAPITYRDSDFAIGIHNLSLQNLPSYGIGFKDDGLRNRPNDFFSQNAVYVDPEGLYDPGTGEIHKPYRTENKAANDAPAGAQVYFARGDYHGSATFNRPMTLRAPVGKVTMGVPFSNARKAAGPTIPGELLMDEPLAFRSAEEASEAVRVAASPNPFREQVGITYQLSEKSPVSVTVFNASGAEVAKLASGEADAGSHTVQWSGSDRTGTPVAPGLYVVRCLVGNRVSTVKVMKGF